MYTQVVARCLDKDISFLVFLFQQRATLQSQYIVFVLGQVELIFQALIAACVAF